MYFRDAARVLSQIDADYIERGRYTEDLPNIHFLRSEALNDELANFLQAQGYSPEEVRFCRDHPRVNVTAEPHVAWTPALIARVARSERLLLRLLETFGFSYAPPRPLEQARS